MVQVDPDQPANYSFGVVAGAPILWNNDPKGVVQRIQNIATWLFVTSIRVVSFGHLASWEEREITPIIEGLQDETLTIIQENAKAKKQYHELSSKLKSAKATIAEARKAKNELQELRAKHRSLKDTHTELQDRITSLQAINRNLTKAGKAAEVLEKRVENRELRRQVADLGTRTSEMARTIDSLRSRNRKLNNNLFKEQTRHCQHGNENLRLRRENAALKGENKALRQQSQKPREVRVGAR